MLNAVQLLKHIKALKWDNSKKKSSRKNTLCTSLIIRNKETYLSVFHWLQSFGNHRRSSWIKLQNSQRTSLERFLISALFILFYFNPLQSEFPRTMQLKCLTLEVVLVFPRVIFRNRKFRLKRHLRIVQRESARSATTSIIERTREVCLADKI